MKPLGAHVHTNIGFEQELFLENSNTSHVYCMHVLHVCYWRASTQIIITWVNELISLLSISGIPKWKGPQCCKKTNGWTVSMP